MENKTNRSIKLSEEFYSFAKINSELQHRSIAKQIEYWASLGIVVENKHSDNKVDDFLKEFQKIKGMFNLKLSDIIIPKEKIAIAYPQDLLKNIIVDINKSQLGFAGILDSVTHKLIGMLTDGDIRRTLSKNDSVKNITIQDCTISRDPKVIYHDMIDVEFTPLDILAYLKKYKITSILVADKAKNLLGAITIHTLLQEI